MHFKTRTYFWILAAALLARCTAPSNTPHTPIENLGRYLFFETQLSATSSKSCATCHDPQYAFSDGYRTSPALFADPLPRNAPALINAVHQHTLSWANPDTRTFEAQMLRPLFSQTPPEMGLRMHGQAPSADDYYSISIDSAIARLVQQPHYLQLFRQAFPGTRDNWTQEQVIRAIGAYERTLISMNSPYDRYLRGNKKALRGRALQGKNFFFGNAGCTACHSGTYFTDHLHHNIGLPDDDDNGLFDITRIPTDSGKFRTPPLRNIAFTGPYFHDGRAIALKEVLSLPGHGQQLTETQRMDIIFFLESLSDSTILVNPWFQKPQ